MQAAVLHAYMHIDKHAHTCTGYVAIHCESDIATLPTKLQVIVLEYIKNNAENTCM